MMRVSVLLVCVLCAACRDGVAPFIPDRTDPGPESPRQLTFSLTHELNPGWSAGSDTVYYTGNHFIDYPKVPNTILSIARAGGIARLISPDADPTNSNSLVLPVLSPKHDRIAYVRLGFVNEAANCSVTPTNSQECSPTEPLLESGSVRVRMVNSTSSTNQDPTVDIPFKGVDPLRNLGGDGPFTEQAYPFQRAYRASTEMLFRPTWSADGTRIAFSDGLAVHIWDITQPYAPVIPNTDDGVSPAWSPTGNTIAFTLLRHTDSTTLDCTCFPGTDARGKPQTHTRRMYTAATPLIVVINPDGSGARTLTTGSEPAWSPDGNWVYYAFGASIRRIPAGGGASEIIPGTQFGRSPAISPDGNWLAFVKYSADEKNSDVWVIRLGTS